MYLSIGSIIVDDIVLPDGETRMGMFGGGTTHAIAGMRVWSDEVGLVSWMGNDFPSQMEAELRRYFHLEGVARRNQPSARAWQIFEWNNHRTEIFRSSYEEFVHSSPMPKDYPQAFYGARGVHLQCELNHFHEWIALLRRTGTEVIVWEPWGEVCTPAFRDVFRQIMPLVDAVSPNLEEGCSLTGEDSAAEVCRVMLADGARVVALRMGAQGSLVARADGLLASVPAVKVDKVVDVTGAGNAYCGGFVVGLGETGDPLEAARWGAVSGSLALEQFGALYPFEGVRSKALQRLQSIKGEI